MTNYNHKPVAITSIQDLIAFFEPIPECDWCVDIFQSFNGQRCAVGHLGAAYKHNAYIGWDVIIEAFGPDHGLSELAHANNQGGTGPKDGTLAFLKGRLSK